MFRTLALNNHSCTGALNANISQTDIQEYSESDPSIQTVSTSTTTVTFRFPTPSDNSIHNSAPSNTHEAVAASALARLLSPSGSIEPMDQNQSPPASPSPTLTNSSLDSLEIVQPDRLSTTSATTTIPTPPATTATAATAIPAVPVTTANVAYPSTISTKKWYCVTQGRRVGVIQGW